jgi:tetratricopeptide (TPR) repeat protein
MAVDTPNPSQMPDRVLRNQILDRFETAWQQGQRPTIESVLPLDLASVQRREVLLHLIPADLELRFKAREPVRAADYVSRFPELAGEEAFLRSLNQQEAALREQVEMTPTPPLQEQFGRYYIRGRLGQGAMGVVYLAHDPVLERDVALKVPSVMGDESPFAKDILAARFHDPNICPVYDTGTIGGIPYLTMRYIDGVPLTTARRPPLSSVEAAGVVRQLALVVHRAHEHGVIHRDLKPANILVDKGTGVLIITDFGLARRLDRRDLHGSEPGIIVGTPAYMSPEQARGEAASPGSDLYSLGVILFELLTGQLPFQGAREVVREQVADVDLPAPPPSQHCPNLERDLETICRQALAKRIEHRHASVADFAAALGAWLGESPPAPRKEEAATVEREQTVSDPRAVADVLARLRERGWDHGLAQLRKDIECAEPTRQPALRVLLGWLAGERGRHAEAAEQFGSVEGPLVGWARTGQAFLAMRQQHFASAQELLDRAAVAVDPDDRALCATIAHVRGTVLYRQGEDGAALDKLHEALEQFGADHFGTGRVLDSLGMVHGTLNNYPAALEFFHAALKAKERAGDDAGVSLTCGQLGRLHLVWDELDQAEKCFHLGMDRARKVGDRRGEVQQENHLAQVLLGRGRPADALALLDEGVQTAAREGWHDVEGFARKDRALAYLHLGRLADADRECDQAEARFQEREYAEGIFHVQHVRGLVRRGQGRLDEAVRCLCDAAGMFEQHREFADAARSFAELARTRRDAGAAPLRTTQALLAALDTAEQSRRPTLVAAADEQVRRWAADDYARRLLRRLQGGSAEDHGERSRDREPSATVIVLEILRDEGEESLTESMHARNHLYADLSATLGDTGIGVVQYQGDGLTAVLLGRDHVRRAVTAAMDILSALHERNRPRRVMGWPLWQVRGGVASGSVYLGPVGTAQRFALAAAGPIAELAAALRTAAESGRLLLSTATRSRITASHASPLSGPRTIQVAGLGPQSVWEVGPRTTRAN